METLHLLQHAFHDIHGNASTAAATAARVDGWTLRRIGTAMGLSHEQVRKMTTTPPAPPSTLTTGPLAR